LSDRYLVERELGQGGAATVYLAKDLRHERLVALKVFRPELAEALGADRFTREIQLAASLQHPHILPVHDSGVADGLFYYVMPFVDGESVRARLERSGELPIPDAMRILNEIADALYDIVVEQGPVMLKGFIADPACDKGNARKCYQDINY